MDRSQQLRQRIDKLLSEYNHAKRTAEVETAALQLARDSVTAAEQAQQILQTIAADVQTNVHTRIASVVSRCLEAVDSNYSFRIDFVRKRGRTEAEVLFLKNGHELSPTESSSGGMIEVAAFALKVSSIIMSRPTLRRLLVLDEPFGGVAEELISKVRDMLEILSKEFSLQIILVTHNPSLTAGKVIRI